MVSPAKPAGGQAKVDSTRKGWDIEELLIAIYYTVSGFVWKTVSEIILVKTGNASIESYHVHEEVGRRIDVHEKLYNKIDDIYHLKEIGKAMLSFMKQRNVDENERTAMWEWITVLKPEEEEIVRNVSS